MSVAPAPVIPAQARTQEPQVGLSEHTQKLWLAAQRYRRLADLAASKVPA